MDSSAISLSAENSAVDESQSTNSSASSGIVSTDPIIPQPSEVLLGLAPPPFLTKTYDMIDDPNTDDILSWGSGNNSFIVWNPPELATSVLPNYFKHSNFSSFVRQLNSYGFRKVDPDRWEFAAEGFMRGQRHLLKTLRRRKTANQNQTQQQAGAELSQGLIELEKFGGFEEEIEDLKRDKNVLMHELVQMRQQQQTTDQTMKFLGQRLAATEQRQRQMMTFLAKTMQNPSIFAHLVQQNDAINCTGSQSRKRQLPKQELLTQKGEPEASSSESQILKYQTAITDPNKFPCPEFLSHLEPASVDVSLLDELFHGLQQENSGEGRDETSISESADPNPNPNESLGSAETTKVSKGGEVFGKAHFRSSRSSSSEEAAGEAEKELLQEGPEELEYLGFSSYEQHPSAFPTQFLLDNNLEDDWNELFESMEVYDKVEIVYKEGIISSPDTSEEKAGLREG